MNKPRILELDPNKTKKITGSILVSSMMDAFYFMDTDYLLKPIRVMDPNILTDPY
jgi:hypothetical protein